MNACVCIYIYIYIYVGPSLSSNVADSQDRRRLKRQHGALSTNQMSAYPKNRAHIGFP